MSSAVILRKRKVTKRQPISVWQRSSLPKLTGCSEEVAWATQIRRVTIGKLAGLADELSEYYRLTTNKGALRSALADVLYEVAVAQTEASWWISNRLRIRQTSEFYNMVGLNPLQSLMPDYTAVFNAVTLAYGITEYGAASTDTPTQSAKHKSIESAVIQGVMCARIKGSTGWISLE